MHIRVPTMCCPPRPHCAFHEGVNKGHMIVDLSEDDHVGEVMMCTYEPFKVNRTHDDNGNMTPVSMNYLEPLKLSVY